MRIEWTQHAEIALDARGIRKAWVAETLGEPERSEDDPRRPERRRAYRRIAERDARWLRVVYEQVGDEFVVITAFFDRNAGERS